MARKHGNKRLIVEGAADKKFFEALLSEYCNITGVWIGPPDDFGAGGQGKGNAIAIFESSLAELGDGTVERIALVVDADYDKHNGLGFERTLNKVQEMVTEYGYSRYKRIEQRGFTFEHPDGLPTIGLWIMPDCNEDGFIEHLILPNVTEGHQALLESAKHTVRAIKNPLYTAHHRTKAEMFTWLAWQKKPGQHLSSVVRNGLLDCESPEVKALISWLNAMFS